MMSKKSYETEEGDLQAAVAPVLRVLSQLGGHFTFTDPEGEQFVIASKSEFEAKRAKSDVSPRQLPLSAARRQPSVRDTVDEVFDVINKEIAVYQMKQQEEDMEDDLGLEEESEEPQLIEDKDESQEHEYKAPTPPPVRVRFEPLRGDLPPELQE